MLCVWILCQGHQAQKIPDGFGVSPGGVGQVSQVGQTPPLPRRVGQLVTDAHGLHQERLGLGVLGTHVQGRPQQASGPRHASGTVQGTGQVQGLTRQLYSQSGVLLQRQFGPDLQGLQHRRRLLGAAVPEWTGLIVVGGGRLGHSYPERTPPLSQGSDKLTTIVS